MEAEELAVVCLRALVKRPNIRKPHLTLAYAAMDTITPPIDQELLYDVLLPILCDHGRIDRTEAITKLNARYHRGLESDEVEGRHAGPVSVSQMHMLIARVQKVDVDFKLT